MADPALAGAPTLPAPATAADLEVLYKPSTPKP